MSEHVEVQQLADKVIVACLGVGTAADWFGFVENHIPFILMCVAILGLAVKFYYARLDAKYKRASELREVEKHKNETSLAKAQIEAVKKENERLDVYSKVMLKKVEKEND